MSLETSPWFVRKGLLAAACVAAVSAVTLAPRLAAADEPTPGATTVTTTPDTNASAAPLLGARQTETPAAPLKIDRWYGYQTLATDGAAIGLAVGVVLSIDESGKGYTNATSALLLGSLATYTLGGPMVHVAHGRYATAGIDVAVRLGAPLALGLIGAVAGVAVDNNAPQGSFAPALGALIFGVAGAGLGVISASVIDASALAREKVSVDASSPPRAAPPPAPASSFTWRPTAAVTPDGHGGSRAAFGVVGTF